MHGALLAGVRPRGRTSLGPGRSAAHADAGSATTAARAVQHELP
ncbi:hypothetical protein [Streptomyces sp. NPDC002845]